MITMKCSELVLDFDLYPRAQIDSQHVASIGEAEEAGVELPPIVADKKSKRVTDGFHRVRSRVRRDGPDAEISVVLKSYQTEKEMFLDALRYNASHGRKLSPYDRAHSILLAGNMGLDAASVATAMAMTVEKVEGLVTSKSAKCGSRSVPIKRTIGHMAGKRLSKPQVEANKKLGGMNQLFYVNQLVTLIESDLLDLENEDLMETIKRLCKLLDGLLVAA